MKYLIVILTLLFYSLPVMADSESSVIKKKSPYSVNETMDNFEAIVKKKGFDVFVRVDHKKNAKCVDLVMNDAQVLIFGNPKGGTMLMKKDIGVALDLPLRVAVYKAADDNVYISYHDPVRMVSGYDLEGHPVIEKVTTGLDKLTSAAIAKE